MTTRYALLRKKIGIIGTIRMETFNYNVHNNIQYAIIKDDVDKLRYLLNQYFITSVELINYASYHGSLEVIKFLHEEKGMTSDNTAVYYASMFNRLDCLKYLHEVIGLKGHKSAVLAAAEFNSLECLQYLYRVMNLPSNSQCIYFAIQNNNKDMLVFCSDEMVLNANDEDQFLAAELGHVEILRYLYEHMGLKYNSEVLIKAVAKGQVEICKYVCEELKIKEVVNMSAKQAAENGHLNCLSYFHEEMGANGTDIDLNKVKNTSCHRYLVQTMGLIPFPPVQKTKRWNSWLCK